MLDEFTATPIQNKTILVLDDLYSKNIKKSACLGEPITWRLIVGVPLGQTKTISWEVPCNVSLNVSENNSGLASGAQLGGGAHYLTVIGSLRECTSFMLRMKTGWNMVSLPLVPANSSVYSVFSNISTLNAKPVVKWVSPSFVSVTDLEPKIGYWVFTTSAKNITVTGTEIINGAMSLKAGWNMVGTTGLDALNVSYIPNQVTQKPPVYWVSPSFVPVNITEPGKASWVFVTKMTTI